MIVHFMDGKIRRSFAWGSTSEYDEELVSSSCAMNILSDFDSSVCNGKYQAEHKGIKYGFPNKHEHEQFLREIDPKYAWGFASDEWEKYILADNVVNKKELFKAVIKESLNEGVLPVQCSVVMGDNSNGAAFKYLFPSVPKKAFTLTLNNGQRVRVEPHVSKTYINGRHKSRVQHVTAVIRKIGRRK